jgi:rhamnogalacturonyl hydrolase YesR
MFSGGYWYYVYPNWSYLDGMFSFVPFYSLYTTSFDMTNTTAVNGDIIHQLDLLWTYCHNNQTGLLVHGYDVTKTAIWANPVTGASPIVWDRALGWYIIALVDFLELTPVAHQSPQWQHVHTRFVALADAIVKAVDPGTGCWWQVMSFPGRTGNYIESSGSAMFVYALYKGIRLGYLKENSASTYTSVASRAYRFLVDNFVVHNTNGTLSYNGTVSVCSLNSTASYEVCFHQVFCRAQADNCLM